jgi:hypothetical protein
VQIGFRWGSLRERKRRSRRNDNIKIEIQEIRSDVDWIDLSQCTHKWRALVNAVMKLRVP